MRPFRDSLSRFSIYHTSNKGQSICRFESTKSQAKNFVICGPDGDTRHKLESMNDLYKLGDGIKAFLNAILNNKK